MALMEEFFLDALKYVLVAFSLIGAGFHLLVLKSPDAAKRLEQTLATELGTKKTFAPWLEEKRMDLHECLINSKSYSVFALVFLVILLVFLFRL